MDIIKDLSELALASRLKRLADCLMRDVSHVYSDCHIDFEPRWFSLLYTLNRASKISVTDLASALSISHTAVNQLLNGLIHRNLVISEKSTIDERQRLLQITDSGKLMVKQLEPIWNEIRSATSELIDQCESNILRSIEQIEEQLDQERMYTRIMRRLKVNIQQHIEILDYRPAFKKYFQSLNQEWLEEYFVPEIQDERILNDPRTYILRRGGTIIFARLKDNIVGTCSLIRHKCDLIELAKMAVLKPYRGMGIGKQMINVILSRAKENGFSKIYLQTNSSLKEANHLYQNVGFQVVENGPFKKNSYRRSTFTMCLKL